MKYRLSFLVLLSAFATAAVGQRVAPRAHASDYAASTRADHFAIGAQQLSKKQVSKAFIPEINREFVVFEIGVYPDPGTSLELARDQFALTTAKGFPLPPTETREVAEFATSPNGWDRVTPRSPEATDIYTTLPSGGHRSQQDSAWWANQQPLPIRAREEAGVRWKQKDLNEKVFPEKAVTAPVAGYLFFRRPPKKLPHVNKTSSYELHWTVDSHPVVLIVPPAK